MALKQPTLMEVDLRSDTLTKPTPEMREAIAKAVVGDDVYREDPTILELERISAKFLGKETALFVPSGTMGNLASIMAHCWERGKEMLVGDESHIYLYEQCSSATVAGIFPRSLKVKPDGTFDLEELKSKISASPDVHTCCTGVICLENTNNRCGGVVLPTKYVQEVCKIAKSYKIPVHMDGARIVNASVYLNEPVASIVSTCDSVSMCLSKGLGAPIGTMVAGTTEFIAKVLRCRKLLGGAMRQVGILGAAGIIALQNPEIRLKKDHVRAKRLAQSVKDLNSSLITVDMNQVQTNIIVFSLNTEKISPVQFVDRMKEVTEKELKTTGVSVIVKSLVWSANSVRCLLHSDINDDHVEAAINKIKYIANSMDFNKQ